MSRYLLDTHIFLWWLHDASRLSQVAYETIRDASNTIYISSASIWEIAINKRDGWKIRIEDDLERAIKRSGFLEFPISAGCAQKTKELPLLHKDPFDRMLMAQAKEHKLTLITNDKEILRYEGIAFLR